MPSLELLTALRNANAVDRISRPPKTIYQTLIDAALTAVIGAGPHERTDTRINLRNGSRPRTISTTAGDLSPRHLAFGDPGVGAQRLDQTVDLAGGHVLQIGLHHHREQALIHPAAPL